MYIKDAESMMASLKLEITKLEEDKVLEREQLQAQIDAIYKEAYSNLTPWDIVYLARHPKRPKAMDYIQALFPDFIELHGDRHYGDDHAMRGGIATFHGMPVTILAQCKGRSLKENMDQNFGMLHPEGYRKALRLAKQAEKFHRPIITLIDTAGAYPGKGAEERGQAEAVAKCLEVFATIQTPVIAIVLSEGGSGGALAFSVADHILMLEYAIYSVLSPEGFASILWKDEGRVQEAADAMELTAKDLYQKGIIDTIIEEVDGGAHVCFSYICKQIEQELLCKLPQLTGLKTKALLHKRYEKFRAMGVPHV